jgi:hypothetical protein
MRPVRRALDPCLCRIRRQPREAVGVLAAQHGIELEALPPVLVRAGLEEELARQVVREGPSEGLGVVEHLVRVSRRVTTTMFRPTLGMGQRRRTAVQAGHPVSCGSLAPPGR